MAIEDTVERAVNESIKEGVLVDFLTKYRAEAIQMSLLEYNEERDLRIIRRDEREIGREQGLAEGKALGISEGKAKIISIIRKKLLKGNSAEEIADILELDLDMVEQVISIITDAPTSTDIDVAKKIL